MDTLQYVTRSYRRLDAECECDTVVSVANFNVKYKVNQ